MICPFCRQSEIGNEPGQTICPSCKVEFEIDERGESMFANVDSPRMPMLGQVCTECGLVQQDQRESSMYCGKTFN